MEGLYRLRICQIKWVDVLLSGSLYSFLSLYSFSKFTLPVLLSFLSPVWVSSTSFHLLYHHPSPTSLFPFFVIIIIIVFRLRLLVVLRLFMRLRILEIRWSFVSIASLSFKEEQLSLLVNSLCQSLLSSFSPSLPSSLPSSLSSSLTPFLAPCLPPSLSILSCSLSFSRFGLQVLMVLSTLLPLTLYGSQSVIGGVALGHLPHSVPRPERSVMIMWHTVMWLASSYLHVHEYRHVHVHTVQSWSHTVHALYMQLHGCMFTCVAGGNFMFVWFY